MERLYTALYERLKAGRAAVLLTVVDRKGSTPRGIGSHQVVFDDGTTVGTVGGGYPEYLAVECGKQCLTDGRSDFRRLILHPNDVEDIDAACGGELTVFCQYLNPDMPDLLAVVKAIIAAFQNKQASWLAFDIGRGNDWGMALVSETGVISCGNLTSLQDVDAGWCRRQPVGMTKVEDGALLYHEVLTSPGRVFIFGGGHVAQALVPVLSLIDFSCIVADDRPEFASSDLFPDAVAVHQVDYQHLPKEIGITADDYVCVMTRGHHGDYDVQRQMLAVKPYYLGVIGSRRKIAFVKSKLLADGFSEADIDACYSPIGLAISAETPAEIAVSIAAELIAVRARREGREKHRPKSL